MLLERIADRSIFESLRQIQDFQRQLGLLSSSEDNYSDNYQYPLLKIWSSSESAIIEVEIPGVELGAIEITVIADSLTFKGIRDRDELKSGEAYHRQERVYGAFARTIRLPFKIDADNVKAELSRGILQISVPRAEDDKPRKISIKSAQ